MEQFLHDESAIADNSLSLCVFVFLQIEVLLGCELYPRVIAGGLVSAIVILFPGRSQQGDRHEML